MAAKRSMKAYRRTRRWLASIAMQNVLGFSRIPALANFGWVMLRGIVIPDEGRFTARMKVVLPEKDGWPYGEFFLNVNSVRKQIWVSEKSSEYRITILNRISRASGAA